MSNWEVTEKRIYLLLKHPYQLDKSVVENMTSAYLEFVEELLAYLNEGKDNKNIIRKLNTAQIEFAIIKAFEESLPTENNKLKLVFLDKLIVLVDKASINPAEAPESVKSELAKINKRQDGIIRFIRNYEEKELNPMIRATNSIAVRFDGIVKTLETLVLSQLEKNQEKHNVVLQKISDTLTQHADVINEQWKQIGSLRQLQKKDNAKFLKLINLYSDLAACRVMDGKRKENLKAEIMNLINEP